MYLLVWHIAENRLVVKQFFTQIKYYRANRFVGGRVTALNGIFNGWKLYISVLQCKCTASLNVDIKESRRK